MSRNRDDNERLTIDDIMSGKDETHKNATNEEHKPKNRKNKLGEKVRKKEKKFPLLSVIKRKKWSILLCSLFLMIGFIFGLSISGDSKDEVYRLETLSLEESIDNFRATQLESITDQYVALSDSIKRGENGQGNRDEESAKLSENKKLIANAVGAHTKNVEEALKIIMNVNYDDKDSDIEGAKEKLKSVVDAKYMSKEHIERLFTGNSASKALRQKGVKSGTTNLSIAGVDKKDNFTYMAFTPYSTDDRTVSVLHLIKLNKEGKLMDIHYVGYVHSYGHKKGQAITAALTETLKSGDKELKEIDRFIETKEEVERREKEEKEKEDKRAKESKDKKRNK
ncbi:hypothetical protein MTQ93_09645 [Staphylococcus agnetis]|uniref:hypothetical protein n=1 Tax=Staphylococcus agnetis TaxID=985762 RepID=UPI00208F728F|nr:hypothetical protein [Staphylococcus agnetis]MCO4346307.1 hypothetical protein [Staphylococcus agnetis]MCO4360617.1 hypothetical protein [Staphylococcus agnetis]